MLAEPSIPEIISRIRAEYDTLPGLSLTLPQAARLWDVDKERCAALLDALVDCGFLVCGTDGRFLRADLLFGSARTQLRPVRRPVRIAS